MPFIPPRLAEALLRLTLGEPDAEVIAGDLEEIARTSIEPARGGAAARRWYWRQALGLAITRALTFPSNIPDPHSQRMTMASVRQDVGYALRSLRRQPGYAATAVIMLALGLGATIAIFALVHAVVLKPLPFADPDQLMLVHLVSPQRSGGAPRPMIWSWPKYQVMRDHQRSFAATAAYASWNWNLTGGGSPERVTGEMVEGGYFDLLGSHPHLGRGFAPAETRTPGSAPLLVIGHRMWTDRFGASPDILGRSIGLNGVPYTVVGVMPPGFRGLTGEADLWVPLTTQSAADLAEKWNHTYYAVARRHPHLTVAQAAAEAVVLGALVDAQIGSPNGAPAAAWGATAVPLDDERVDPLVRRSVWLLLGAVVVVLLIVCINLANLTVARGLARQRDVAIRLALGASRVRILSLLMTESTVLAVGGAIAAVGVAYLLLMSGATLMPDLRAVLPRAGVASGLTRVGLGGLEFDAATLLFTMLVAAAAAVLFGLLPAWRASRRALTDTIKRGGPAALSLGSRALSGRTVLIVVETALALVLLTAGGLMLKSVARLQATELGFDPDGLLSIRVALPSPKYDGARAPQFLAELLSRLQSRGQLGAVAIGSCAPVQGGCNMTSATFPDRPSTHGGKPAVGVLWASPSYFDTLGIRLVRGRVFSDHDRVGQPKVVVINETAARALWPGEDPLGQRIAVGQGGFQDGAEVVGIVSDVRYASVDRPSTPDVYLPLLQSRRAASVIFVRSSAAAAAAVPLVRAEVQALDADLPLTDIRSMTQRVNEATWQTRISAWLLGTFAMVGLVLVAIGVYGVISQAVQQRTREIGVRLAIGANRADIFRLIIGRAFVVALIGIAVGLAAAVPSMRLLTALLYEVRPADPWVFAPLALVLLAVSLLAAYVPARWATRLDPLRTLRME